MASTTLGRALSFSSGATASSRSRNVMSAGTVGALARNFSLEPGVERHERRGRSRERADRGRWYQTGPAALPGSGGGGGDVTRPRRGAVDASRRAGSAEVFGEERHGAIPQRGSRVRVVHLGPGVVEERMVGAGIDDHLDRLAQAAQLFGQRVGRLGREEVV